MSKKYGCLLAFVLFLLFVSLAVNLGQFVLFAGEVDATGHLKSHARPKHKFSESIIEEARNESQAKIVHLDLDGIISSAQSDSFLMGALPDMHGLKLQIEQAVADADTKAIVLRINSPGGEVTASDILYNAVKKASAKKPVVVYMDSMAASGGYYVACGATKIVASETTLTASIGVIIETMSYYDLFNKVGLGTQTFASGAFKDSLSGSRPMRDDEKAYVQNLVTQMYGRFLGIVSGARGVPADELKATVADGRVVTGREALKAKLVDQIGYVEDAYALARELAQSPDASVVKYRAEISLLDAFGFASAKAAEKQPVKLEVGVGGAALPKLQPGVPYYLPSIFAR